LLPLSIRQIFSILNVSYEKGQAELKEDIGEPGQVVRGRGRQREMLDRITISDMFLATAMLPYSAYIHARSYFSDPDSALRHYLEVVRDAARTTAAAGRDMVEQTRAHVRVRNSRVVDPNEGEMKSKDEVEKSGVAGAVSGATSRLASLLG